MRCRLICGGGGGFSLLEKRWLIISIDDDEIVDTALARGQ